MGDKGKGCKEFRPMSGMKSSQTMFAIKNMPSATMDYMNLAERKKQRRTQRISEGLVSPRMRNQTTGFGGTKNNKKGKHK